MGQGAGAASVEYLVHSPAIRCGLVGGSLEGGSPVGGSLVEGSLVEGSLVLYMLLQFHRKDTKDILTTFHLFLSVLSVLHRRGILVGLVHCVMPGH